MLIYSQTIFVFIQKAEKYLKDIIKNETPIELRRSRFVLNNYIYPIHIVVFEGESRLAYFDPHTYQIGINRNLIYQTKEDVVKDILRHEFAHYLTYIEFGGEVLAHGAEFNSVCEKYNWPEDVSRASGDINLMNDSIEGDLKSEKVIRKIQALLKLAQSSNIHESELATLKANELLLKHNIEKLDDEVAGQDSPIYVHKVIVQKRKDSKISAIYDILKHFMVKPVLNYGKGQVSLEVTGSKMNIELAEYIADFLVNELDRLWDEFRLNHGLKGLKAKNSFFHGLARGYDQKMNQVKDNFSSTDTMALQVISNQLEQSAQAIYRRLSSSSSKSSMDSESFKHGQNAGKNLHINKGIKNKAKNLLLGWRT